MELEELRQTRKRRLKELCGLPGWAFGSLVETERKQGRKRKPFRYLSRSVRGRNRITYISEAQVDRLRNALCSGGKAKKLLDEIADLTVAIIKAETRRKEDADERTS